MSKQRGSSLLVILLIGTFLSGLLVSVGASTVFHLRATTQGEDKAKKELAARAGLQHALALLRDDSDRTETLFGTLKNGYSYEVEFVNNEDGNLGPGFRAPDGTPVAPGHVYLKSITAGGVENETPVSYAAQAWQPPITVNTAAFGSESVKVADSDVAHWESSSLAPEEFIPQGQIAPSLSFSALKASASALSNSRPPTMKVTAKFTKALLGTNSSSLESLFAEGNSSIDGNVAYCEGAPVSAKSGVVSVIGADPGTAQNDGGQSPFAPSQGPDDETVRIPDTVDFSGDIEVFSNRVPFPQRPPIAGTGFDETFEAPIPILAASQNASAVSSANSYVPQGLDPDDFAAEQAFKERTLAPGRYGKVTLEPGSIVRLEPGVYEIDEIDMEQASLLVDKNATGTVILTVKNKIRAVDSEINRYQHAGSAYLPDLTWNRWDLEAQAGDPTKLEIYFQGEPVSPNSPALERSKIQLNESFLSAATIGKMVDASVTGGAVHGAFLTNNLELDSTKLFHASEFQNPRRAVSTKGAWTFKSIGRLGTTDSDGKLEEEDPWQAVEDAWTNSQNSGNDA